MKGLVVKKAYVLGKYDGEYGDIISKRKESYSLLRGIEEPIMRRCSTTSSVRLHSVYRPKLVLHACIYMQGCQKTWKNSSALNKTIIGFKQAMIVGEWSIVLGYAHLTSSRLNADYHSICKSKSGGDANSINVENVLKLWASRLVPLHPRRKCLYFPFLIHLSIQA